MMDAKQLPPGRYLRTPSGVILNYHEGMAHEVGVSTLVVTAEEVEEIVTVKDPLQTQVLAAFINAGDALKTNSDGKPSLKWLSGVVGARVSQEVCDSAWEEYRAMQGDTNEPSELDDVGE